MWTDETRSLYDRRGLRYPSDLTDAEWDMIAPLIPPGKRGGRQPEVDVRAVVNGLLYVLENGCTWRCRPKDFPPRSTVHGYLQLWAWDGTLDRLHHALYVRTREHEGREASPTAALLDSQSVRSAGKGGPSRMPWVMTPARESKGSSTISWSRPHAGIQDGEGALLLLTRKTRALFPFIQVIFADGGYHGQPTAHAVGQVGQWELSIVKRSDPAKGFVVLPKRWIVERTLAWLSRCRRLVRNYEHRLETAVAFVRLAIIRLMVRRLCRQ